MLDIVRQVNINGTADFADYADLGFTAKTRRQKDVVNNQ